MIEPFLSVQRQSSLLGIVQSFQFPHGGRERQSETIEIGLEAFSDGTSFQNRDRKSQIAIGNVLQGAYGGLRGIFLLFRTESSITAVL